MSARKPDDIDRRADLSATDPVFALRGMRPEFVRGAEDSRAAVLTPEDDLGLSPALRLAVLDRVTRVSGEAADAPTQRPAQREQSDDLTRLAQGVMPEDPILAAIARHADLIAVTPGAAGRVDLDALARAGLDVPQIIALSELLAYAAFRLRIARGLALLKGAE